MIFYNHSIFSLALNINNNDDQGRLLACATWAVAQGPKIIGAYFFFFIYIT